MHIATIVAISGLEILICTIMYTIYTSNNDTYIAYVFPETYTEQTQKQTYCKPTKRLEQIVARDQVRTFYFQLLKRPGLQEGK